MFKNTFADIEYILTTCAENNTRFEIECYDIGHLYTLRHFLDRGVVKPPLFVQSVFGILGGIGTHPEDVIMMKRTADRLLGRELSLVGARRRRQSDAGRGQAAAMGGNVRVGMEDSLWIGAGQARRIQRPAGHQGAQDPRRARARDRQPGRGARNPLAQGRRQGGVLDRHSGARASLSTRDCAQARTSRITARNDFSLLCARRDPSNRRVRRLRTHGIARHRQHRHPARRLLVLAGILSSLVALRFGAPLLLVFLLVGMLAGEGGPGGIKFDDVRLAYTVGSVALGADPVRRRPAHAASRPSATCWRRRRLLATVGVLVTAALTAPVASLVLGI